MPILAFNIDLDQIVRVRLTDSGKKVLAGSGLDKKVGKGGWYDFQLSEVMSIFGTSVSSAESPFQKNRIRVP